MYIFDVVLKQNIFIWSTSWFKINIFNKWDCAMHTTQLPYFMFIRLIKIISWVVSVFHSYMGPVPSRAIFNLIPESESVVAKKLPLPSKSTNLASLEPWLNFTSQHFTGYIYKNIQCIYTVYIVKDESNK